MYNVNVLSKHVICNNRLFKIQKKIYMSSHAIQYFIWNEWKFENTNSQALMSLMPLENREMFSLDLSNIDTKKLIR